MAAGTLKSLPFPFHPVCILFGSVSRPFPGGVRWRRFEDCKALDIDFFRTTLIHSLTLSPRNASQFHPFRVIIRDIKNKRSLKCRLPLSDQALFLSLRGLLTNDAAGCSRKADIKTPLCPRSSVATTENLPQFQCSQLREGVLRALNSILQLYDFPRVPHNDPRGRVTDKRPPKKHETYNKTPPTTKPQ